LKEAAIPVPAIAQKQGLRQKSLPAETARRSETRPWMTLQRETCDSIDWSLEPFYSTQPRWPDASAKLAFGVLLARQIILPFERYRPPEARTSTRSPARGMLLERQSARSVQYVKPSGSAPSGCASPRRGHAPTHRTGGNIVVFGRPADRPGG